MFSKIVLIFLGLSLASCQQTWPQYFLFTRSNPDNGIEITQVAGTLFSASRPTKILIHGFGDSAAGTRLNDVKQQLLIRENVNVIMVDWKQGAQMPDYFSAAANAKTTGTRVGNFLAANSVNPKNVHCIGHSLGAHACGFAGKVNKLQRISGLDPAGPLFKGTAATNRLDKADADLVDNIHTDSFFGIQDAIGHKDYYPNGGKLQAGCGLGRTPYDQVISVNFIGGDGRITDVLACSHVRVPYYFAESINGGCGFTSIPCNSYDNFVNGLCSCNSTFGCSKMGYDANQSQEEGKFFLDTNKESPFCKN